MAPSSGGRRRGTRGPGFNALGLHHFPERVRRSSVGLDISLYTRDERAQDDAYDKASEELHAEGPDGKSRYDLMTKEERDQWYDEHKWVSAQDAPSEKYPEHLCNRRYLRSSYNSGGFNSAVPQMLGHQQCTFYWIFEPLGRNWQEGDDGDLTVTDIDKLLEGRARALGVEVAIRACDRTRVTTVSPNMFGLPPRHSDEDALNLYRREIKENKQAPWGKNGYVGMGGNFRSFGEDGLTVFAAIPGVDQFDGPGVHLIFRVSDDIIDHYAASAYIAAEFCDEAVVLIKRDGTCHISWSG